MSDYCKECSEQQFDKDFKDLANLVTKEEVENGIYAWSICECCGYIQVDHEGKLVGECEQGKGCYHGFGCHENKV